MVSDDDLSTINHAAYKIHNYVNEGLDMRTRRKTLELCEKILKLSKK